MRLLVCFLLLALVARPGHSGDTLVLYENEDVRQSHSFLFAALQASAVPLHFRNVNDLALRQFSFPDANVTGLLLLAPSVNSSAAGLTVANVQAFLASGGSLFVAGASPLGTLTSEIMHMLGFDHDSAGAAVDHHHHLDGDVTQVLAINTRDGWPLHAAGPLLYHGIGLRLNSARAGAHALVRGATTTFIRPPRPGLLPYATGSEVVLVGAWTGPRGARAVVSGSLDMLSDVASLHPEAQNQELAPLLVRWALGVSGVARVSIIAPATATAGHELLFSVQVEEGSVNTPVLVNLSSFALELVFTHVVARVPLAGVGLFEDSLLIPSTASIGQYTLRLVSVAPGLALMPHDAHVFITHPSPSHSLSLPWVGLVLGVAVAAVLSILFRASSVHSHPPSTPASSARSSGTSKKDA